MESQVTVSCARQGFVLIMVLIVTAIGLLFGAGALLLFRYQCQLRIDRQHELEKVYAVRSALNFARTYTGEITATNFWSFNYYTGSERNLSLVVKPVSPIFPDKKKRFNDSQIGHFVMEDGHLDISRCGKTHEDNSSCFKHYNYEYDYEYGGVGVTNLLMCNRYNDDREFGLGIEDPVATNSVKWWVNIGMRETGGWLQEDYGRRYYFWPKYYANGSSRKDVVRLCLIRNVTNESNVAGQQHGWPLSKVGEMALVLQVSPRANGDNNARMELFEYEFTGGEEPVARSLLVMDPSPALGYMGVQIANDKVSIFYNETEGKFNNVNNDKTHGYIFSDTTNLTVAAYAYFAQSQMIGGKLYGGVFTNDNGKVESPDIRAVFEIEASSDLRSENEPLKELYNDFLTYFRVSPAYQYDVYLVHPSSVTNLATVAQKMGKYNRYGMTEYCLEHSILTYDTHGTENKGFRKDEREAERKRNGW